MRDIKLVAINIMRAGCQLCFAVYKINGMGNAKKVKVPTKGIYTEINNKII